VFRFKTFPRIVMYKETILGEGFFFSTKVCGLFD